MNNISINDLYIIAFILFVFVIIIVFLIIIIKKRNKNNKEITNNISLNITPIERNSLDLLDSEIEKTTIINSFELKKIEELKKVYNEEDEELPKLRNDRL